MANSRVRDEARKAIRLDREIELVNAARSAAYMLNLVAMEILHDCATGAEVSNGRYAEMRENVEILGKCLPAIRQAADPQREREIAETLAARVPELFATLEELAAVVGDVAARQDEAGLLESLDERIDGLTSSMTAC